MSGSNIKYGTRIIIDLESTNLCAKAKNLNLFLLAYPMCTVLSLQISLWIPEGIGASDIIYL